LLGAPGLVNDPARIILNGATTASGGALRPPTTITVRTSTRHLLEAMKRPGETYDELIQEIAEEYYPPRVIADLKRRVSEIRLGRVKGVPAEEMRRRLGL
jgi:hypothetical protein